MGRYFVLGYRGMIQLAFQFMRPVWGATLYVVVNATIACAISIYAPRMGRYVVIYDIDNKRYISIYAPRMGRYRNSRAVFRSIYSISIYAPRMGRYVDPIQFAMSIASFQFMRPVWGATVLP